MILSALVEYAERHHLFEAIAFKEDTPVRWIIHLDGDGRLIGPGPVETSGAKPGRGRECAVPRTARNPVSGTVADFLADDIGAIFALAPDRGKPRNASSLKKRLAKHEDYWRQVEEARAATGRQEFAALLAFRRRLGGQAPPFLTEDERAKSGWAVKRADGTTASLGAEDLLTFAVGGQTLIFDEQIRNYWQSVSRTEIAAIEKSAPRGVCLATGRVGVPIARTHTPMVTGLPSPAKGTGAGLVGFEDPAFCSYGFDRSFNAPTALRASKCYLLALQRLSRSRDHWIRVGPSWLCVWSAEAESLSSLFARLLRRADPAEVRAFVYSPWSGQSHPPASADRFYAATLTAAGPRLVIKGWLDVPLAQAAQNIQRWFADLAIEGPPPHPTAPPPLAIPELARCAAPLGAERDNRPAPDEEKLPPDLPAQLYAAALSGSAPPLSLVRPLLGQLRSRLLRDEKFRVIYDHSRFALLKLILNRNRGANMEAPFTLAADTADPAYNAGRLLAVLHAAQAKARRCDRDGEQDPPEAGNARTKGRRPQGPGVAERYFGAASTSPATVFPLLLRLNRHHLKKIAGSERYGSHSPFIERQIRDILARFGPAQPGAAPEFPRLLDLHAQGRFALGFYQQAAADAAARKQAEGGPAGDRTAPQTSESSPQD